MVGLAVGMPMLAYAIAFCYTPRQGLFGGIEQTAPDVVIAAAKSGVAAAKKGKKKGKKKGSKRLEESDAVAEQTELITRV